MKRVRPPRFWQWLLQRAVPPDQRDDVAGDLHELLERHAAARGGLRARWWYRAEATSIAARFAWERLRGRVRPLPATTASRTRVGISTLDVRLGFRMLVKYPVLTIVGGLAMSFAIWVGASAFEIVSQVVSPRLRIEGADRVVALQSWDASRGRVEPRVLRDFVQWRASLRTVQDVGAYRLVHRNLVRETGAPEPVTVAEVSAAAFRIAGIAPRAGRVLLTSDEGADAAPVAVLSEEAWERDFQRDPGVLGRSVRVGMTHATIVGVMPERFSFPASADVFTPLRYDALEHARGEGPELRVFGRLADDASLEEAQAELAWLGRRMDEASLPANAQLRPRVLPFAKSIFSFNGTDRLVAWSINLFLVMLLVLVCGNVALLMFARAATRETDFVVRNALGASRARIVTQLFTEALVLGGIAAALGLAATGYGIRWAISFVRGEMREMPFWFTPSLGVGTYAYAIALTMLGAVIAGVVPGLRITKGLQDRLRQNAVGGGLRFGGVWTVVIVAQVAVTVAFPFTAFMANRMTLELRDLDVGFEEEQFLALRLEIDREDERGMPVPADVLDTRYRNALAELDARLMAEPGVAGVTIAEQLPRMYHPHRLVEMDAGGMQPVDPRYGVGGHRVSSNAIDVDYFDVLGVTPQSGRLFTPADYEPGQNVVVVTETFVRHVLGARNPLGRRLRYVHFEEWEDRRANDDQPWYEIVGVVRDLGAAHGEDRKVASVFHPLPPGGMYPLSMAVHVQGDPTSIVPRVRAITAAVDPTLRLQDVYPLDQGSASELRFMRFWFRLSVFVSVVALTLSLTGIYAVMSFTVSRRTREIGIRVALGADRRRVIGSIFRRPLAQVAAGITGGILIVGTLIVMAEGADVTMLQVLGVGGYALLMMAVCMLSCIVPTRRALRIEPTEALREG